MGSCSYLSIGIFTFDRAASNGQGQGHAHSGRESLCAHSGNECLQNCDRSNLIGISTIISLIFASSNVL